MDQFRMKVHSDDTKQVPFTHVLIPVSCDKRAIRNHRQSLAHLHGRGGCGIIEIACLLKDLPLRSGMQLEEALLIVTPHGEPS